MSVALPPHGLRCGCFLPSPMVIDICIHDGLLFLMQVVVGPAALSASLGPINKTGGNFQCPACHVLTMNNQHCNPALYLSIFSKICHSTTSTLHWI